MACGPQWLDRFIPDSPLGFQIRACCKLHDLDYGNAGERTRREIDIAFLLCMLAKAREGRSWLDRRGRYMLARLYFRAVRVFGWISWLRSGNSIATME